MKKVISRRGSYLKYGFVKTETTYYLCPTCGNGLNAGPNYQPKFCDQCGEEISFEGIEWEPDKTLGYAEYEKNALEEVI